ncbi:2,3-diaminopropionate biosynthesis protein SbnB [Amycolatopsis sp. PS_44_ISF1]|uniref:2,3-diaminopropionate biosynthesis protein SbnB n=1 Tax=Amycolatopsis sp. PS_44_ISF1 TaxID=2974917 RepID=UPI0028E03686|nr:2,3-diaminopropionate biosynthesis protein SbnB [Amycolatopsis sp. PS_44_ISF1]MDT8912011.1 2,3-diaminopropionate biosynthesis protein SbnB [Amycolatopsis sp. PS_44_ISF1]
MAPPLMTVIGAGDIAAEIDRHRPELTEVVRAAYLVHDAGDSSNPHSSFLRFPHRDRSRIISLPAYLGGEFEVAGNKWIASFPDNTRRGLPRASATLILNDCATGYPFACLESSIVSATRTAASAVLGAQTLLGTRRARRVGIVGTGLIARHVWRFLRELGWEIGGFRLFDLDPAAADRFGAAIGSAAGAADAEIVVADRVEDAFTDCDLVLLTTVAGEPHVHDPCLLAHHPVVLHLSLRDLAPELILAAQNFTDDVDHAVRERTSLHLTEQRTGNRDFIDGTLGDLLRGRRRRDPGRPAVFSPFGLGVLDLAVGQWVHDRVVAAGRGHRESGFFTGAED